MDLSSIWTLKHPKQYSGITLNLSNISKCLLQPKLIVLLLHTWDKWKSNGYSI